MMNVRLPAVAGMFYTADPKILSREIDKMLEAAIVKPVSDSITALVVPHAGYVYSGLTAAHAYKLLRNNKTQTVIIISPSHREYFGGISIYSGTSFRTPLGDIQIDDNLRDELVKNDELIECSVQGHQAEHAIEVQLPFLQKVLDNFKIVPIVMGDQNVELCRHLGNKLAEVLKERDALIIASSDLSHYHSSDDANALDRIVIDNLTKFNDEKLAVDLDTGKTEACGGGPIIAALTAARKLGASRVEILHHCNSGDITGERDAVVGYVSAAIIRKD
jgi:AmmeMemoRadiSam system protein B